jgi:hypothetical protein
VEHHRRVVVLRHDLQHAVTHLADDARKRTQFVMARQAARHGEVVLVDVDVAGAHAGGAGVEALPQEFTHLIDLVRICCPGERLLAHHPHADQAVTDKRCDVDADRAAQRR